jgi:Flp pilus assembly protein TadD
VKHSLKLLLLAIPLLAACTTVASGTNPGDEDWAEGADREPDAKTLHSMARLYTSQGRDADAEVALRNLVSKQPDFTPAYEELARLYVRRDQLDGAIVALEVGLEQAPQDPVLLNDLGVCHLLHKDPAAAADAFTRAAAAAPDDSRPRGNLALALALQGRNDEALALWQQILPPSEARKNVELAQKGLLKPGT